MRCARCQKPLTRAAVQDGPLSWGPKCAVLAGFIERTPHIKAATQTTDDEAQMSLTLERSDPVIEPGHKYELNGLDCIALHPCSGGQWRLREIAYPWLGRSHVASPEELKPLPMKYFHGDIPQ